MWVQAVRFPVVLCSALLLLGVGAVAGPTKQECKVFAGDVKTLGKELGVSAEITGRALMSQVESWIAEQDPGGSE